MSKHSPPGTHRRPGRRWPDPVGWARDLLTDLRAERKTPPPAEPPPEDPFLRRMLGGPHWTGKPTARRTRRMVLLECPSGHLLRAVALSDWAGSRDEMRAGDLWHCYARPTGRQR